VTGVALSQLRHEVTVEHCLSHLNLLICTNFIGSTVIAAGSKSTNPCLVEDLVLVTLTVYVWKHIMDARVIR